MIYKRGKFKPKNKLLNILFIVGLVIILAGCSTALGLRQWYVGNLKPLNEESVKVDVVIPSGYTVAQIADLLQESKVIKNATAFEWYIRFANLRDKMQAGEYQLDSALSAQEVALMITKGKVNTALFTILPGQRLDEIKTDLIKAGFDSAEIESAFNTTQYKNHPALASKPSAASLEGYLYPESFQTTASSTAKEIVEQALDQMAEALSPSIIDGFEAHGLTTYQGLILASIVEQEASSANDRKMVAGVFYNRLAQGIALGSDVTYHYAAVITGQEPTPFIDSPYNTRKYAGLPPGPISNVSASSLDAVAHPIASDYLFFVAGDPVDNNPSVIYYSKTQAEHEALAREYCKSLCSTY